MRSRRTRHLLIQVFLPAALCAVLLGGCLGPNAEDEFGPPLRYVGSSTIGNFIRDAESVYGGKQFLLDTEPESAGGEVAILEGRADLAGVAGHPSEWTLKQGVTATLLGQDSIAVVVHADNPVGGLTRLELSRIFSGTERNWRAFGGADLVIKPYVVARASATRQVFRSAVLGQADYNACEIVRPDVDILRRVAADPGGIGTISLSFLGHSEKVNVLAVDGEQPLPSNANYSITRPLYLLSWPRRTSVADFIEWTRTPEAEAILLRRFSKARGVEE